MAIVQVCLVLNIITLTLLLVFAIFVGIWFLKKEEKHYYEKHQLKQSRDYHIKQLKERSEQDEY